MLFQTDYIVAVIPSTVLNFIAPISILEFFFGANSLSPWSSVRFLTLYFISERSPKKHAFNGESSPLIGPDKSNRPRPRRTSMAFH